MIKVFVIDDSAVVRQVLTEYIKKNSNFQFIGSASDPIFALEKMNSNWPDVIILDIEMPRMDGLTFLKKIMAEKPTPIIICSTLTEKNASITIEALREGAVEIITKPKVGVKGFLEESFEEISNAILSAYHSKYKKFNLSKKNFEKKEWKGNSLGLIAIGASTGGTIAIESLLTNLNPEKIPGIVIVQHMPEKFTNSFANRLNQISPFFVKEAKGNEKIQKGHVFIAPGGKHLQIKKLNGMYYTELYDGNPINRHKPSVDVLFQSVSQVAKEDAVGILLTGMGNDGAQGMLAMKQSGAYTIAQDEESCVVFGMPKEAILLGAVDKVLHLEKIPQELEKIFSKN